MLKLSYNVRIIALSPFPIGANQMIFTLTFKTPYVLDRLEFVEETDFAQEFVKYGEYITVEFDTEKQTATAVPIKRK